MDHADEGPARFEQCIEIRHKHQDTVKRPAARYLLLAMLRSRLSRVSSSLRVASLSMKQPCSLLVVVQDPGLRTPR